MKLFEDVGFRRGSSQDRRSASSSNSIVPPGYCSPRAGSAGTPYAYARRFRRLLPGKAHLLGYFSCALYRPRSLGTHSTSSHSALHHRAQWLLRPRLTSTPFRSSPRGDFAGSKPAGAGTSISQGKTRDLRSIYPSHLRAVGPGNFGLRIA